MKLAAIAVDWPLVLEFLKVLLTAPVIGGAVMLAAMLLFKKNFRSLIDRIARIKVPGVEVSTSQQEKLEIAADAEKAAPVPPPAPPPKLEEGTHLTPKQVEELRQFMQAQDAAARIWEYRYLNFFLADSTQAVLDWLVTLNSTTTLSAIDAVWMPIFPNAGERGAIIDALQRHLLISVQGQAVALTPKGREYAAYPERVHQRQARRLAGA